MAEILIDETRYAQAIRLQESVKIGEEINSPS